MAHARPAHTFSLAPGPLNRGELPVIRPLLAVSGRFNYCSAALINIWKTTLRYQSDPTNSSLAGISWLYLNRAVPRSLSQSFCFAAQRLPLMCAALACVLNRVASSTCSAHPHTFHFAFIFPQSTRSAFMASTGQRRLWKSHRPAHQRYPTCSR